MKKIFTLVIMAIMVMAVGGGVGAYATPAISFVEPPTPADGETITETSVEIEVSIIEAALTDVTFNWNGTDYALYDDSLVLMFNFDNVALLGENYTSAGDLVKDISGWGNDGYLSDESLSPDKVPSWISNGKYGGAFDFTGNGVDSGQSILVVHSDSLNPYGGDFAIAVWILTKDDYDGDVLRKGSTGTASTWYKVEHAPGGDADTLSLNFNTDGTDATITSTQVYNDNQWHFVVAQRNGSQAQLWIDGVLDGSTSISGSISNTANLAVGSKDTQNDDFINSTLDEVRIYMRSFSQDEIQELYYSNLSKYDIDKWTLYVNQSDLANGAYTYQAFASDATETNYTQQRSVTVGSGEPVIVTLVAAGADWKYDDTNTDLYIAGWPVVGDTGWSSEAAPLGYGDPHIVTSITMGGSRYPCYYFRHGFTVEYPSLYESVTLRVLRDDGCVVYLNGTEVVRSNMPAGEITHNTLSSTTAGGADETTYFEFSVDPALLVAGENMLAVDVHQCNTTSSDLGFDLELEAVGVDPHSPYQPTLVAPADGATGVSTSPTLEVTVSDPDEEALDVAFFGRQIPSTADEFTIIVLPDTQNYSEFEANAHIFTVQTQWIVDNIDARNIVFVTHEGDIVENPGSTTEYDRARESMSLLDPGLLDLANPDLYEPVVPYGVLPGNHDQPTVLYNQYFPYTRYDGVLPWYGGHYPETGNDNNYQLFTAGGEDYIILHIEFCPGYDVLDWGNWILQQYSERKAIIVTHGFINEFGERTVSSCPDTQYIWDALVVPNDNVWFVLCGHNGSVGEALRTDIVNGHPVYQLLSCYQRRSNGGDGWLRIMQFVPAEDTVYVYTYSPWLDQYETDGNSEFTLNFPMSGSDFAAIGSVSGVQSGTNTSIDWPDLAEESEYEWYVTVTDPTDRTAVGPVWSFTTGQDPKASNPSPVDGAIQVATDAVLSWTAGVSAQWHDVYFGTVNPPPFIQNQVETTYNPALEPDTTYYWRIDEFDGTTIHTGDVWSFTTLNQPPVAVDDAYSVDEDNTLSVAASGVLTNDTDAEGETLTAALVDDVANGTLTLNPDGSFSYTPDADFFGSDTFTYKANDGTSDSDPATVTITVEPINDPPTANDDSASTLRDVPVVIDVLSNDNDVEGDTLSVGEVEVTEPAANGSVVNNGANVTYTPAPGYTGGDSFSYKANDGTENGNAATVTVTVNAPGPTTLFSDGFESGDLATGGWTSSGSVFIKEPAAYDGLYGAQIGGTASIVKSVSTVGFADIHVRYARKTKGLDSGESLTVEWSADGTAWNEIESTQDTAWAQRDIALGAEAGENAAFSVRFRTNANKTNEYSSVDSVEIIGTPAGPVDNPPSVTITNPTDGATLSDTVTVQIDATDVEDAAGTLTVEWNVDSGSWQPATYNSSSGYYEASWDTIATDEGNHTVNARATDSASNTASTSVGVTVDNVDDPPSVTITNPTEGATVSSNVTVSADATDDRGMTQMEFFVDGASIGVDSDGSDGWSANWDTTGAADGPHTVSAVATDTATQTASDSISVTVNNSGPSTVHVQSIAMSLEQAGKNWKAVATVLIHDQNGPAQSGATVVGDWYLNDTMIQTGASGITDGTGYAEFTSAPKKAKSGDVFEFVVTDVVLSGYIYDAGQGVTSGSITVP